MRPFTGTPLGSATTTAACRCDRCCMHDSCDMCDRCDRRGIHCRRDRHDRCERRSTAGARVAEWDRGGVYSASLPSELSQEFWCRDCFPLFSIEFDNALDSSPSLSSCLFYLGTTSCQKKNVSQPAKLMLEIFSPGDSKTQHRKIL